MEIFEEINYSEINLLPKLISDYILGNEQAKAFYSYLPDIGETEKIIQAKKKEPINRAVLASIIGKQYRNIEINEEAEKNCTKLLDENTFCIVTAHQLNIFTGPLYYLIKIACTISTCRLLQTKYPQYAFVPVYWMGSEDHDFEEINHIHVFNKKLEWQDKQGGATGQYTTESLLPLITDLQNILGDSADADFLIELFKTAYAKNNLADAARLLLNNLFGKYGLLCIDGNDSELKRQMIPVFLNEIEKQTAYTLVNEQLAALEEKNYKQQAYPREINLFYLSKNSRERIIFEPDSNLYVINNTAISFTKEQLIAEIENHPERFSPNVILRPLFQQKVLPSIAYIGGAGELGYWLQLKTVFDYHQVQFPQLFLRNSVILLAKNELEKWENAGFTIADLFKSTDELKKEFVMQNTAHLTDFSAYKNKIKTIFSDLENEITAIDATLKNSVGAEQQKAIQSLDILEKKTLKSLKQKSETELNRIEKIKNKVFPDGIFQERYDNFSMYYAKSGNELIQLLVNSTDVYEPKLLVIGY